MTHVSDDHRVNPPVGSRGLCEEGDSDNFEDLVTCGICNDWEDLMLNFDEEPCDAAHPRVLAAPSPPSTQEALEHMMTHLPFRSWCPFA